jgi:oxaloacetate decarboxylase (Na+ extruding) subunit alpha
MTYLKAIEAGVDIIDTAISPFSGGMSLPATESMVLTLKESGYDPKLGIETLGEIADYFKPIKDKYRENGILSPKIMDVEPRSITNQVPGEMLSNLLSQLKAQGAEFKYEEVLREIPMVREDLGFPPMVTPISQMVGTQAVFNVLSSERYKMVSKEIKEYVRGFYGTLPGLIKDEVKKKIIGDDKVITQRPADLIKPQLENFRKEIKELAVTAEDVMSYALFPQIAKKFFENRLIHHVTVKEKVVDNSIYEIDEEEKIVVELVASAMAGRDKPNSKFYISKIKRIK